MPHHHMQHMQNVGPNLFMHNENHDYIMPYVTTCAVTSCMHCTVHTCRQAGHPYVTMVHQKLPMDTPFTQAVIQFPPEMDENWVRYGLAKLGQISRLPNWQRMLFCAYTTQLLHSTGEVCWNNNDSYFIWFEFVCRNSGQIASRRSWKRSCLGLEYTSKCSRLALLWEPN